MYVVDRYWCLNVNYVNYDLLLRQGVRKSLHGGLLSNNEPNNKYRIWKLNCKR